jgi:hypothetical protein
MKIEWNKPIDGCWFFAITPVIILYRNVRCWELFVGLFKWVVVISWESKDEPTT